MNNQKRKMSDTADFISKVLYEQDPIYLIHVEGQEDEYDYIALNVEDLLESNVGNEINDDEIAEIFDFWFGPEDEDESKYSFRDERTAFIKIVREIKVMLETTSEKGS